MVIVVDGNEVTELQVAGSTGSLASNTFHSTTITENGVGVIVEKIKAGLIEDRSSVSLCDSETHGVGETLAKGTGSDFDTRGVVGFGMTRGFATDLLWKG